LVILLSAFNGIEKMIEHLYSEFDTDITIRPVEGKTFYEGRLDVDSIRNLDVVTDASRVIEEVVILKHEDKWVNANLYAVDSNFLGITRISKHMVDGQPKLQKGETDYGLVGATLLDKIDGFIPKQGHESIVCYVPKKKIKIRVGKNPFRTEVIQLAGRINYNKDVNLNTFIIPISLGQEILESENRISAVFVDIDPSVKNELAKAQLQELVGSDFVVKTNYEKNELIYKTSKSEKLIVLSILLFIFVLAAFNLVASLTMLFVEKGENIKSMVAFGASKKFIFKLFFYEGLLISGKGVFIGMILGYAVAFSQLYFSLLTLPNSGGEAFPIEISALQGVMIFSLVAGLSLIFSFLPVKYLIRRNVK
jgi:lipoprotein-releasing system permease protein